jgi:hypothetical protein
MDKELIMEFMKEDIIPDRVKFDDYLSVALGMRQASQIVLPAELPDASVLGATIDERFRQKQDGKRLPGESMSEFIKGKVGKYWRKSQMADLRHRMDALRTLYSEVVEKSHSYQVFMKWADRLGLKRKELESRPTIREVYLFTDPSVATMLTELQDMRKDIRYRSLRMPDSSAVYARAFPEEQNPAYLKMLGGILGFPECCIDRYVFDRQSGVLTPESRSSSQLVHMEDPNDYSPFAYFAKDFFPCQPDCGEAAKMGENLYQKLLEIDQTIADRFKKHLQENVSLIKEYPELIRKKVEMLERFAGRITEGDKIDG